MVISEITPIAIDYIRLPPDAFYSIDKFEIFYILAINPPIPDKRLVSDMSQKVKVVTKVNIYGYLLDFRHNGPLARYVTLQVAHAPGMPGTFSLPPRVSDPVIWLSVCVKTRHTKRDIIQSCRDMISTNCSTDNMLRSN